MVKHVTLVKLTDEGRKHLKEARDVLRRVDELIASYNGKTEGMWATTGPYDFFVVADYPTSEMGLKARTKLLEMEFFQIESYEAFSMDTFLATV